MKKRVLFVLLALFCWSGTCFAKTAVAELKPTDPSSRLKGQIKFTEEKGGVVVLGEVWNAPPGKHGFHIHEKGDCSDGGKAAGGHFNPSGNPHGFAPKDFPLHCHPGDMGNFDVDTDGHGTFKLHMPELGIAGRARYNIIGRSVIFHENADDFSQPTGNAGGRIACGIIEEK